MSHESVSHALEQAFTSEIRCTLIKILDDAYQAASARFDPEEGCNGFTFGTDLYHFVKFRLQGRGEREAAPLRLGETSSELELRVRVDDFNVAIHRVGASASEDIAGCFPSSNGGPGRLARLNAIQLELDLGWGAPPPLPTNVIVAHLGNPENGLEAVYLAIPLGVAESGKINAWAHTELVWQWDGEGLGEYNVPDLPPAVPIDDAVVRIRRASNNVDDAEPTG